MTKADFYVGRGKRAVWIGSVNHDGYPSGMPESALGATSKKDFRERVRKLAKGDPAGVVLAFEGWPWPWPTSATTDYVYAFDDGCVWVHGYEDRWVRIDMKTKVTFPKMAAGKDGG